LEEEVGLSSERSIYREKLRVGKQWKDMIRERNGEEESFD
jgi:hypothetical protein